MTLFSDERIQTEQLTVDGTPSWWISNRVWFTHSRANPDQMPVYSFISMKRLDPVLIEEKFGKPSRVLACPSGDIWLYDDGAELTRRFHGLYARSAAGTVEN